MRPPDPDAPSERLAQIDGLRFVAIVMVMLHHYMPDVHFPLVGQGVSLFFVLSGFFATRQLLRAKRRVAQGEIRTGAAIARFHARRYLRIFPVYYLVVGCAILAGLPYAREGAWWHLTFTSNWYVLRQLDWMGPFSPFWSLAVLEQFYVFWPTLVLCLPRQRVITACLALMGVAMLWRMHCYRAGLSGYYWLVHPLAGFDLLGAGALLAVAQEPGARVLREWLRRLGLWVAAPFVLFLLYVAHRPPAGDVYSVVQPLVMGLFFAWVIDAVGKGVPGPIGYMLGHTVARLGGRLSYSIFAFHEFTAYLIPPLFRPELPDALETMWRPVVLVVFTCALAGVVYLLVESPFLRLKRRFQA